jgi:hypothetical protein
MRIGAALLLVVLSAGLGWAAGDGAKLGESFGAAVIRPGSAPPTPAVSLDVAPSGGVGVSGAPVGQKLPREIQAALAFLIRWGKGRSTVTGPPGRVLFDPDVPVTILRRQVKAGTMTLVFPVKGLTVEPPDGVRVAELGLKAGSADYRGPARLTYTTAPDGWVTITGVEVAP